MYNHNTINDRLEQLDSEIQQFTIFSDLIATNDAEVEALCDYEGGVLGFAREAEVTDPEL